MMVTTFFMVATWIIDGQNTWRYYVDTVFVDHLMQIVEILLMIFIIYMSFKYKKRWVCLLSIFQTLLVLWVEYTIPLVESTHTQVDSLALLMCVICAVIGGLIGIYSVGYMKSYHENHRGVLDRSSTFLFFFVCVYGRNVWLGAFIQSDLALFLLGDYECYFFFVDWIYQDGRSN